jgi:hypothetical protein
MTPITVPRGTLAVSDDVQKQVIETAEKIIKKRLERKTF